MSLTESATPNHSALPDPSGLTANEEVPRIDDSVMIPLEPNCSNNLILAPTGANLAPTTVPAYGPITESGTFLTDFLLNCFEAHLNNKWSRDLIEHNKALEEVAQLKQQNQELSAQVKADKDKIMPLREQ